MCWFFFFLLENEKWNFFFFFFFFFFSVDSIFTTSNCVITFATRRNQQFVDSSVCLTQDGVVASWNSVHQTQSRNDIVGNAQVSIVFFFYFFVCFAPYCFVVRFCCIMYCRLRSLCFVYCCQLCLSTKKKKLHIYQFAIIHSGKLLFVFLVLKNYCVCMVYVVSTNLWFMCVLLCDRTISVLLCSSVSVRVDSHLTNEPFVLSSFSKFLVFVLIIFFFFFGVKQQTRKSTQKRVLRATRLRRAERTGHERTDSRHIRSESNRSKSHSVRFFRCVLLFFFFLWIVFWVFFFLSPTRSHFCVCVYTELNGKKTLD